MVTLPVSNLASVVASFLASVLGATASIGLPRRHDVRLPRLPRRQDVCYWHAEMVDHLLVAVVQVVVVVLLVVLV